MQPFATSTVLVLVMAFAVIANPPQAPDLPQAPEQPISIDTKPSPKLKKTCPCSPQCECGCNEGQECRCNEPRVIQNRPVLYYRPEPVRYTPQYSSGWTIPAYNYQYSAPSYAPRTFGAVQSGGMSFRGGAARSSC